MRHSIYILALLLVMGCETSVDSTVNVETGIDTGVDTGNRSDTESETVLDTESATDSGLDTETSDTSSDTETASETATEPVLHPLTAQELDVLLPTKDFEMINVHIPWEGEVPGTDAHISYTDPSALAAYLGSDLTVMAVIYCKSNGMAMNVGAELLVMGYSNIHYLDGGMNAWENAGYTLD